jgi:RNA polymerase sigma-70 factor (sigma-E family)
MPAILGAGESVGSGDREQFHQFMVSRWPKLVRLAYGLTGDRWAAEDLAQIALANAYAAWWRVRRADDPDAYVRKILINACNRRFRRKQAAPEIPVRLEAGDEPYGEPAGAIGERSALMAALTELSPRQRAVIVLRYWEDMTDAQVAATLGCAESTVRSQAARALAKLRSSAELADGELADGELEDGEARNNGHAWEGG